MNKKATELNRELYRKTGCQSVVMKNIDESNG